MNRELIEKSKQALILAKDMSFRFYDKPLIITYSGGKDSDVLAHLAKSCLKPNEFELSNSHTSVDAPETVYHIREKFNEFRGGVRNVMLLFPKMKKASKLLCGI